MPGGAGPRPKSWQAKQRRCSLGDSRAGESTGEGHQEGDGERVEEPVNASSVHDVLATEPVIRRVVSARATNPSDVDDLVQDCLERLLSARGRLAPEALLPFGIVTARNLVISHARTAARRATAAPRIADVREPDRPEDVALASEASSAMTAALARLSPQERSDILAYHGDASPSPGSAAAESPGALRVRMSRTRAKLRLEYLLAFRHIELPSPQCRRVLLAISGGDTRRQRELAAGQHLLGCETCAALSEPLDRRSLALTAITFPAELAVWVLAKARAHPLQAAASAATGTAVATAAVLGTGILAASPRPAAHSHAPPCGMISGLTIGGQAVDCHRSLRALIGQPVDASGITVEDVVTRNGFWIGSDSMRIWVELVGPLQPLRILDKDHLRFAGTVVVNGESYAARAGVTTHDGAALLTSQGAHISVMTTRISVQHKS